MRYFEIGSDTSGNTNVQRLKWQKKCGGGGTDRNREQREKYKRKALNIQTVRREDR